jgi:PAS domain S-box-containing protein
MAQQPTRVLLIDDDEDDYVNIRATLQEITNAKYDLVWKSSYQEGLQALIHEDFDVCLLDFRLGQYTGLELLRETQNHDKGTPMILLTGHGDFDLDLKAMQSGAADYLVKAQISPPVLERTIRYAIKRAFDLKIIEEQKESFQILFNSTFEGIIVHRHGTIVDANKAAGEIFQVNAAEMIERPLEAFVRTDYRNLLEHQLATGREFQLEAIGLRKDGGEIYMALSSRTVTLKGQKVSLIAVRDLTQRKQMESQILQQDRLASLGLLASSLAHEIGTPLGVIRGRAEMLNKSTDEKTKSTSELIVSQIDRIAKLVNSLLHIARGQQSAAAMDVSVGHVLDDVLNLMGPEIEQKGITLKVSTPGDVTAKAESGPLGQVILNILVNAIHAIEMAKKQKPSDPREISLEITQSAVDVEIKIRDTGCGISEKNLSRLFQPFFTTKDIGLGTGLGLATSYKLVDSWGGSIQVESKEGVGSAFKILLRK